MNETLKRLEEKFGLYELHPDGCPFADPDGCLAFVIDSRSVVSECSGELRLAVGYGDGPFPPDRGQGFPRPVALPGPTPFLIHVVGTEGNDLRVYERGYEGHAEYGPATAEAAVGKANEILASISDGEFLRLVFGHKAPPDAKVSVIQPLPPEDYVVFQEGEPVPVR